MQNHLLAVTLLGTDLLKTHRGVIKFTVYLNNQLDKTVGARSTSLGGVLPARPTSAYTTGNILASNTSLNQVNMCYASVTR